MSIYGNQVDPDEEEKAAKRAAMKEELDRKNREREEADKESARNNLKRKINYLKSEQIMLNTKIQTLKQVVRHLQSDQRKESEQEHRDSFNLEQMKREFTRQKSALQRLSQKIQDLEKKRPSGDKKRELQQKEAELKKLENDEDDVDHQLMRFERELKDIR